MKALEYFFKLFPPPALLTMPHSGVSATDSGVRIMRFSGTPGDFHIAAHAFIPLAPGVINSGSIEKAEDLAIVLRDAKKRYSLDLVAMTIPDEKAYIFKTSVPNEPGMDLVDAVSFKIQETVPVSGAEAVFDFTITSITPQTIDLVVRVVHKKTIAAYTSACDLSGLRPVLFKIESQAVVDTFAIPEIVEPRIVIHIKSSKTICMIVEKGAVIFSIVLDVGANTFAEAIKKSFGFSDLEARKILAGGQVSGQVGGETKNISHEEFFFSITNIISVIRDQVIKLQEFWRTKENNQTTIQSIILSGSTACLDGLSSYLEMSTGIAVKVANVWQNSIDINVRVPEISLPDSLDHAAAIGLALPPNAFNMFNLLPEHEKSVIKKDYTFRLIIAYALGAISIAILAVALLVPTLVNSYYHHYAANSRVEEITATDTGSKNNAYLSNITKVNDILAAWKGARSVPSIDIFSKIIAAKPSSLVLNSINYRILESGIGIEVQGLAKSRESLRAFTDTLSADRSLHVVPVPISEFVKDSDIPFSLSMTFTP